jgi:hypothetical protein
VAIAAQIGRLPARRLPGHAASALFQLGAAEPGHPAASEGLSVPADLAAGTSVRCRVILRSGA